MKRIVAILLAGILTLGMAVTAFAAPSQEGDLTDGIITNVTGGVTKDEIEFTNDFAYSEADVLKAAEGLGIDVSNAMMGVAGDLHLKSGKAFTGSATITFDVADIIAVIHYTGSAWELVGTSNTATFANGFSPVAFIVKKGSNQGGASEPDKSADQKTNDGSKSPQTGEAPFVAIMSVVALIAAAGIVVSRRKVSDR